MSARDDQPATVPPPAGEDDAYSATTKVGAMPADIMEKLRAEGLLPDEPQRERETPVAAMRPSTSLDKRPAPPSPPSPSSGAPVPQLYSSRPPPQHEEDAAKSKMITARPPPPEGSGLPTPLEAMETPVAFAMPPPPKLGETAEADEATQDTTALTRQPATPMKRARAGGPSPTTLYLVAALVVVALIVALLRLRG